jgi:hypothetical protein
MHGFHKSTHRRGQHRPYQRRGRHFRNGDRAAALRAWTAARILLRRPLGAANLNQVADMTGANKAYVAAMLAVMQAEDTDLEQKVLAGEVPVLKAAAAIKTRVALVKALRSASAADLAKAGAMIGVDSVFDRMIVPSL